MTGAGRECRGSSEGWGPSGGVASLSLFPLHTFTPCPLSCCGMSRSGGVPLLYFYAFGALQIVAERLAFPYLQRWRIQGTTAPPDNAAYLRAIKVTSHACSRVFSSVPVYMCRRAGVCMSCLLCFVRVASCQSISSPVPTFVTLQRPLVHTWTLPPQMSVCNMLVVGPAVVAPLVFATYNIPDREAGQVAPDFLEYLKGFVGSAVVVEVLFFYAHWGLHHPAVYGAWGGTHTLSCTPRKGYRCVRN